MHLAIIGSRGVPAAYGGYETFVDNLSRRLAVRGHHIDVYCRRGRVGAGRLPPGVRQIFVPMMPTKHLETVTHTAISVVDAVRRRYDAVLMVNAANAAFALVPRLTGTPVALNVDGIERKRAKWGAMGKAWYRVSEHLATVVPDVTISDARVIERYYMERYGRRTVMIPYGTAILERDPPPDLSSFGLEAGRYVLFVSRLEPENNAHLVIEAYRDVPGDLPLVVVGDAPYASGYKTLVGRLSQQDARVRLLGGVYGSGYKDLQRGARAYVQATEVGGTHPALIEAMGAGNIVLANATPENEEVAGGTALLYSGREELSAGLVRAVKDPVDPELQMLAEQARQRARSCYSWDAVTDAYEAVLSELVPRR